MRATKILWATFAALVLLLQTPAEAWNRKGDKFYKQAKAAEVKKNWEEALDLYEKAILEDPEHIGYQMGARRVRFQASQQHVDKGQKIRVEGKLEEALAEFQKAYAIDPSSSIAEQEIRKTLEMINRDKEKPANDPKERGLTPVQEARKETEEKIASMQTAPELKPINRSPITLKMSNQPPKILFETICKLAGINVIFDTEYQQAGRNFFVDLNNATLDQALDYVAIQTKSFWKPLSNNTIFVTADNVTKRRDYEDMVVKTFYLSNVTTVQELQEIATAVRAVTEVRRLFTYNGQYVIIIRGTVDQVALAEKLVLDLDKPKAEVVVDVVVMEMSKTKSRELAASVASGGNPSLNIPVSFTPRNPVLSGNTGNNGGSSTTTTTTTGTGTGTGTGSTAISLAQVGRISTNDFSLTLPGAVFKALFSNREGRVLQSPQVRAVEMQKASLRLGDKIPFASGSFQPGFGAVGTGISPLVSTQFQFAEVGVNVDITPKVHGPDEVSLHVELELSTVRERVDIGGLQQPVIGQRKMIHDIRMREGEVNLLGGLTGLTDSLNINGIPGVGNVPLLRRLFSSESKERIETELVIALVPHIVRAPEITPANLRGISAGNDATVKLSYAPRPEPAPAQQAKPPAGPPASTPATTPGVPTPPPTPMPGQTPAPKPPEPTKNLSDVSPLGSPAVDWERLNRSFTPVVAGEPSSTVQTAGWSSDPGHVAAATSTPDPATGPGAAGAITPTVLAFHSNFVRAQMNAPLPLVLNVSQSTDLVAAPMRVQFDPKILRLVKVMTGNALNPDGQPLRFIPVISNETGEAQIDIARAEGAQGVSNSGPLLVLQFEAIGRGTSQVQITDVRLMNSKKQPSPATVQGVTVAVE